MASKKQKQNTETESKVERKKLTSEQRTKQVNAAQKIGEYVTKMKELLPEFEGKAAHTAFENSVINLEKKVEQYSKGGITLTDEDKEILAKVKSGKFHLTPIEE